MHLALRSDISCSYLCDYLNGLVDTSMIFPDISFDIDKLNNKVKFITYSATNLGNYYYYHRYDPVKVKINRPNKYKIPQPRDEVSEEQQKQNQDIYYKRSKKLLKEIILSNIHYGSPRFLTLTYATPQFDKKQANLDFKNFIKRLKYTTKIQLRYVAVSEEHDSQSTSSNRVHSYHFHVLIFDLPFLSSKVYAEVWRHGFIRINRVWNDGMKMANYVSKYMSKSNLDAKGSKRYLASRNVLRPVSVSISDIPLVALVRSVNYNSFTGGVIHREIYKIKNTYATKN